MFCFNIDIAWKEDFKKILSVVWLLDIKRFNGFPFVFFYFTYRHFFLWYSHWSLVRRETFLFIICHDYVLQTSEDLIKNKRQNENTKTKQNETEVKGFIQKKKKEKKKKKKKKRQEADDILLKLFMKQTAMTECFLQNTPAQAIAQLHSQEQAAKGIGLSANSDKTDLNCFNLVSFPL